MCSLNCYQVFSSSSLLAAVHFWRPIHPSFRSSRTSWLKKMLCMYPVSLSRSLHICQNFWSRARHARLDKLTVGGAAEGGTCRLKAKRISARSCHLEMKVPSVLMAIWGSRRLRDRRKKHSSCGLITLLLVCLTFKNLLWTKRKRIPNRWVDILCPSLVKEIEKNPYGSH